jgi:hypothetical protein
MIDMANSGPDAEARPTRRTVLRGAGIAGMALAGAGAVMAGGLTPPILTAGADARAWRPDPDDPRFTLAVIPDTQYLFDADRGDPAPLAATLGHILEQPGRENIVFTAHLGDIVENAAAAELAAASRVFRTFDRHRIPYSVLAGNHDIDPKTDDQRGPSPYLDEFGPHRFQRLATYGGATPDGYNTYHHFRASGRQWLLFALDWRPSSGTLAWVRSVLGAHPTTPAILTTHELAYADAAGRAHLSPHGQHLWDNLISGSDQIFLTINGHFWPPGRTVLRNAAGNDVHVHITNYQDRYYGGSAMIRLYRFDLARNTIDVETFSPWILGQRAADRNPLERLEVELTDPVNRFSMPIDFARRFAGFAPVPAPAPRPADRLVIAGTVAYWRFDQRQGDGTPVPERYLIEDRSGRGNHLTRVTLDGSGADALRWSSEHHRNQPGHGSLFFAGARNPARGAYLRTADRAPLNAMTFRRGYTIEAFVKLPSDARDGHAWMGVLSRTGTGADAGKAGGDPREPVATLSLSDGLGAQWAVFPLNQDGIATNWGHELAPDAWFHVAVVNDGRRTVMYVDGCEVLRNPSTPAVGLATTGEPWLVGANHYDRVVEQGFYGWIGDVRIVDRPLPPTRFMNAPPGG